MVDENLVDGNYVLDAVFLIDNNLSNLIEEEAILKVKLDYGDEVFRIRSVRKNTRDITVVASQITITETLALQLEDVRPENQNGQSALQWMLDRSVGVKEIRVMSDIQKNNTAYYQDISMYKAIHDSEQSFLNRWGGYILRRCYDLNIKENVGMDRGFEVVEGKNLTGFEVNSNVDNLITRIKPKGYNGITIDGYINSGLIDRYARVYTRTIKYDDVKVKNETDKDGYTTLEEAQKELTRRAKLEFTKNKVDELQASYRVNFAQLEKTEEYKNYSILERVFLGDYVKVKVPKLDINIVVRALRRSYDVLRQRVKETELSNVNIEEKRKKPPTIGDILNKIESVDINSKNYLQDAKDHATNLITNGLKDSNVICRKNEILIMDTKDINTATRVWRWNINGLGYSNTGYFGEYGTAITMDGSIVADFITTGLLTANLIRTGKIQGSNSFWNLDTGEINFTKGKIQGGNSWWDLATGVINLNKGRIQGGNSSWNLDTGEINLNKGKIQGTNSSWDLYTGLFSTMYEAGEITLGQGRMTSKNYLNIMADKGIHLQRNGSGGTLGLYDWGVSVGGNKVNIITDNADFIKANIQTSGSLTVRGNKNCIQETKEYGDVPFYANEDINSLLTKTPVDEVYETKLYETGKYKCIVKISGMIRECINTDITYNVWLSKLGEGDIWISGQYAGYFVVESDRPVRFKYKLEGRRKGFEDMNEQLVFDKAYKKQR